MKGISIPVWYTNGLEKEILVVKIRGEDKEEGRYGKED
jgi:hypothetical protein